MGRHAQRNAREIKRSGSMCSQEFLWMITFPGEGRTQRRYGGSLIVAVVNVRHAYTYDVRRAACLLRPRHRTRCYGRLRRCLYWRNQRSWDGDGKDFEFFLQVSMQEIGVRLCTMTTSCSQDRDHLLMQYGSSYESAMRQENK